MSAVSPIASPGPSEYPENLPATEGQYESLIRALPDAVFVHSNNRIIFANPACLRLFGAARAEDILGHEVFDFIHPSYRSAVTERISSCGQANSSTLPLAHLALRVDQSCIEIETVAISVTWNGLAGIAVIAREMGAHGNAEQELQEWEKRLQLAQKAGLRIGLWEWDFSTNKLLWSDETYRQFGYTRENFRGSGEEFLDRIHPEDRPRIEEAIQSVINNGSDYEVQFRVVRPDRTTSWIDSRGVIIRNGVTRMIGIAVDVTEQKKAELARQQSEERYRLLLNSTAEAIYGLDLDGNCTFCNPACLRLLGYESAEDLLGKNMHYLIHHSRDDGSAYPAHECRIYVAVRDGQAMHAADEVLWRADGTSFKAEYWSYPMFERGILVGAVVTFMNVSDRIKVQQALQQSEQKYRELFENATYGILRSTWDGTLLDVNPGLVHMLGYDSKDELMTRNLGRDIYSNAAERVAALKKWEVSRNVDVEVDWRRKDGKIIAVRMSGRGVRAADGRISYFEVIVEDITEKKTLESQFRQAQKMEAIGRLAGGIAHDFNNALGVITGYSEMLQLQLSAEDPRRAKAEEIFKAGQRAAGLTRQLLAFSRKQALSPVILDLNSVVTETDKMLRRLIGENIELVLVREAKLGRVRADQGQLEQVLMNLAVNARDAMPHGGKLILETANVELDAGTTERYPYVKSGHYVMLSVTDSGCGMDALTLSHIFEPFFTTKEAGKGTGLGLSTVYGIMKQSGGYVWADSEPGKGARFRIFLPQVDAALEPVRRTAPAPLPQGNETILLVEDEAALRGLARSALESNGYSVLDCKDAKAALEFASQFKGSIHVLLTDVILPDLNGRELSERLVRAHPELRVVYMSGYADELTVGDGVLPFDTMFLQKPFTIPSLLQKIRDCLHAEPAG
jgi:PAS domain S-box-containing protein